MWPAVPTTTCFTPGPHRRAAAAVSETGAGGGGSRTGVAPRAAVRRTGRRVWRIVRARGRQRAARSGTCADSTVRQSRKRRSSMMRPRRADRRRAAPRRAAWPPPALAPTATATVGQLHGGQGRRRPPGRSAAIIAPRLCPGVRGQPAQHAPRPARARGQRLGQHARAWAPSASAVAGLVGVEGAPPAPRW